MTDRMMSRLATVSVAILSIAILGPPFGTNPDVPPGSFAVAEATTAKKEKKEVSVTARQKCPPGQTAMPNRGRSRSVTCM